MQISSCWQSYLKGENYDSDTKNCMNTSLYYEDLNAQKKENSKCVHNLPFLFYARIIAEIHLVCLWVKVTRPQIISLVCRW